MRCDSIFLNRSMLGCADKYTGLFFDIALRRDAVLQGALFAVEAARILHAVRRA